MELRFWVVGIILFSGIFGLMTIAFHDAASGYGAVNVTNPELEAKYNRIAEQEDLVESLKSTTEGPSGLQILNILGTLFTATIGVLSAVLSSLTFLPSITADFASDFGVPTVVTNLFFTMVGLIITTLIIFAILNSARK